MKLQVASHLGAAVVLTLTASAPVHAQPEREEVLGPDRDGSYIIEHRTFRARVRPDGSVVLRDRPNIRPELFGASFDITDAVMRSQGMDPYASEKLRFLDQTRDSRVAMGREYRAVQLSHAADHMRANIDAVWATIQDPAGRKQALFELWDECAETGDPALVAAGNDARAVVIEVIQRELAGPDGYTDAELARLNAARSSVARFEPYGNPRHIASR